MMKIRASLALTGLIAALAATPLQATAGMMDPIPLGPGFTDHPASAKADDAQKGGGKGGGKKSAQAAPAAAPIACTVAVVGVADERRLPETVGMAGWRAVKAPADGQLWVRNILGGLEARGVKPVFTDAASAPAGMPRISVSLKIVSIATISTNKASSVLFHVTSTKGDAAPVERNYRGTLSQLNWAGTAKEFQELVDTTFGLALDDMAVDLKALCA